MKPTDISACIDACVLAGAFKRHFVLRFAEAGVFQPFWTEKILVETEYAIARIARLQGCDDAEIQAQEGKRAILKACPAALITIDPAIVDVRLPDPGDHHVLATAVYAKASILVTDNVRDFPRKILQTLRITIMRADDFLAGLAERDRSTAKAALEALPQRVGASPADVFSMLKSAGLNKTARTIRDATEAAF